MELYGIPHPTILNYYIGPGIERRTEVFTVKSELKKINIFLEGFDIKITGVTVKPRPIGFDFDCGKSSELLTLVKNRPGLGPDNRNRPEGAFVAKMSKGKSFRQPGKGRSLHMIIALNGKCNVHLDTHGIVDGRDGISNRYDYGQFPAHGYWDLLADKAPGLFGTIGENGMFGPYVGPMKGLDGRIHWFTVGLIGTFD
jgi:hypothetical protein